MSPKPSLALVDCLTKINIFSKSCYFAFVKTYHLKYRAILKTHISWEISLPYKWFGARLLDKNSVSYVHQKYLVDKCLSFPNFSFWLLKTRLMRLIPILGSDYSEMKVCTDLLLFSSEKNMISTSLKIRCAWTLCENRY